MAKGSRRKRHEAGDGHVSPAAAPAAAAWCHHSKFEIIADMSPSPYVLTAEIPYYLYYSQVQYEARSEPVSLPSYRGRTGAQERLPSRGRCGLYRGKSGLSVRSRYLCPPAPAAAPAALYGDYRHSRSCLDVARARAGAVGAVGRVRIRAILGTIFLPPERQNASTEDFRRASTRKLVDSVLSPLVLFVCSLPLGF
jgi:hypothetical protein